MSMYADDDTGTPLGQGEPLIDLVDRTKAVSKVCEYLTRIRLDADKTGDVTIALYQLGIGSTGAAVNTWTWTPSEDDSVLADLIVDRAVVDAQGQLRGGAVKYSVKGDGLRSRCNFTLSMPDIDNDDLLDEVPNTKGSLAQQMRHNEKLFLLVVKGAENATKVLERTNERLMQQNEAHEGRQIEMLRMMEELRDGSHQRAIEIRKIDRREKNIDKVSGLVMQMGPHLINKLMAAAPAGTASAEGGSGTSSAAQPPPQAPAPPQKILTEESTPTEMMVEALLETVTEDQIPALMSILTPAQVMTFKGLWEAVQEKQKARGATP